MLLLGGFAQDERPWAPDWETTGSFTTHEIGIVTAIQELAQQELLVRQDNRAVATFGDVNPSQMKTVLNGDLLVEAMDLGVVEKEDWLALIDTLHRVGTIDFSNGTVDVEGKRSHRLYAVVPPRRARRFEARRDSPPRG